MEKNTFEFDLVIAEIKRIRKCIPEIGSWKLCELIKTVFYCNDIRVTEDFHFSSDKLKCILGVFVNLI